MHKIAAFVAMMLGLAPALPAAAGPSGGALPPVLIEVVAVAGLHGVPFDAKMVATNITVVSPVAAGFATVFACDEDVPKTSNVNYGRDDTIPNLVLTRVAANGTICIATHATADLVVDVSGYVPAGSAIIPLASPVRIADTRDDSPAPVRAGTTTEVVFAGRAGVADDAQVVLFNLTAVGAGAYGHLVAYPCGEPLPKTSSVNYGPSQIVANFVVSRVGEGGAVCIDTPSPVELIVDVAAYASSGIVPLDNPVRLIDTRQGAGPVAAEDVVQLDIAGRRDVPASATTAVYNLTATTASASGFATSYPCDIRLPEVSNLNYVVGRDTANSAITKLSDTGELCVYTQQSAHLIVDLIGYTEGGDDYVPVVPARVMDTREGWQRTCDWLVMGELAGQQGTAVRIFNAVTGEIRSLTIPDVFQVPPPGDKITIADTCDRLLVLLGATYEVFFTGKIRRTPLPESLGFSPNLKGVHSLNGDAVVRHDNGVLYHAETGDQVGLTPDGSPRRYALSPNGIAVTQNRDRNEDGQFVEVWDVASGTSIWRSTALPEGDSLLGVSPDGTYFLMVAYGRDSNGRAAATTPHLEVRTLFGDLVDRLPIPPSFDAEFAGSGSLLLCATDNGMYQFDLYGPVTKILPWDQFSAALRFRSCSFYR